MPNLLLSARSRSYGNSGGGGGEGREGDGAWYGIGASAVTLLLFCTLAATVSVWMAFVFAGLALVAFGAASWLAPASWRARQNDAASAEGDAALAQRRFGLTKAAISALPTFAYELKGGDDGGDLEAGDADMCSVCLEDVQAGDMVRRLPACRHLFHVECVDMWLHSHRTCPVCRCDLSPPEKVPGKAAAAAAPAPAAATTETEPAAHDAVSPV